MVMAPTLTSPSKTLIEQTPKKAWQEKKKHDKKKNKKKKKLAIELWLQDPMQTCSKRKSAKIGDKKTSVRWLAITAIKKATAPEIIPSQKN